MISPPLANVKCAAVLLAQGAMQPNGSPELTYLVLVYESLTCTWSIEISEVAMQSRVYLALLTLKTTAVHQTLFKHLRAKHGGPA